MISSGEAKQASFITAESLTKAKEQLIDAYKSVSDRLSTRVTNSHIAKKFPGATEWAQSHRLLATGGALGAVSLADEGVAASFVWGRHKRNKFRRFEDHQSATIAYNRQGMPAGSAAGLNNQKSAWLQPDNQGYDNPNITAPRHGIAFRAGRPSSNPTLSRPVGSSAGSSSLRDMRRKSSITMDQQLSSMF